MAEIADALNLSIQQVSRYINESEIGKGTKRVHGIAEAEWGLDMSLKPREDLARLEKRKESSSSRIQ